jgi:hypothetical protein
MAAVGRIEGGCSSSRVGTAVRVVLAFQSSERNRVDSELAKTQNLFAFHNTKLTHPESMAPNARKFGR